MHDRPRRLQVVRRRFSRRAGVVPARRTSAEASKDLTTICRANTQLLERTCDSTGFDSSLPLASVVRRSVTRSDDPQLHSLVHLAFGRLEAKAGRFAVAQRHFHLARGLLLADSNLYLASSIDLDESVALWLAGDIVSAIELAERGATTRRELDGLEAGSQPPATWLASMYVPGSSKTLTGRSDWLRSNRSRAQVSGLRSLTPRPELCWLQRTTSAASLALSANQNEPRSPALVPVDL